MRCVLLAMMFTTLGACAENHPSPDPWEEQLSCGETAVYVRYDGTYEGCMPVLGIRRSATLVSGSCVTGGSLSGSLDPPPGRLGSVYVGGSEPWYTGSTAMLRIQLQASRIHESIDTCEFRIVRSGAVAADVVEGELAAPCLLQAVEPPGTTEMFEVEELLFRAPLLPYSDLPAECAYLLEE